MKGSKREAAEPRREQGMKVEIREEIREEHPVEGDDQKIWQKQGSFQKGSETLRGTPQVLT